MWLSFSIFLINIMDDDFSYSLIVSWRKYLMLKGLLCGLWSPHWLEWHYRIHCLLFLSGHDKGTLEIGVSLDFAIIIVSKHLSIDCINYVPYPFWNFSCSYALQSDLDCFVTRVTLIKYLLIVPGLVFLYYFYAN